jgi:putative transposase
VVIAFIDDHRDRFGVAPICRVLTEHGVPIASNSYYANKSQAPSARSVRDARVLGEIERVHGDPLIGRGLYGVRKVHAALARQGGVDEQPVSRRQVERLMRSAGIQGARRGRRFVTTRADKAAVRPPDLVKRQFSASAPNRLWVVDLTYVPTWSGMAFTAVVPTYSAGGSWAGAPRPRCRPRCRWTRWRWPCGPAGAKGAPTSAAASAA